ncbi:CPII coat sec24 protein [Auriculariales sp. MPI-PUGE-AT-0066]|nr:CPII coat sec24 protein [Auriculariales sp. MPI-PUGE-AT-0066]
MADPALNLPPGWNAHWDPTHQRYLFVEAESGHQQWEHPLENQPQAAYGEQDEAQQAAPAGGSRRRQYAAEQTQAYYGDSQPQPSYGVDPAYGQPTVGQPAPPQQQLFTPGLTSSESQPHAAQGYPGYSDPAQQYGQQMQQQQQQQPNYGVQQLADQFGGLGVAGQKPLQLHSVNLLNMPPNPAELLQPPPEIRLPPGACLTQDPRAQADPTYMRCTLNAIPTTSALLSKTKLPLALVLTPHRSLEPGEPPVPLVTDTVIARCRRCRTYINPYVSFIDGGNRWKCCMCAMSNEVPQMFDWDQARNQPGDRWARPELNCGVVEFVAAQEYMVRPPQPLVYIFLLDVSHVAVQSGMLAVATRTILESLDRIPNGDNRTKIAIIGFDVALYFFSITAESTDSNMLVMSDVDDVFLPKPSDLLVNLSECRAGVETLLGRMQTMFADSSTIGSALGAGLQAGFKMISNIGGKMVVMSNSLPTLGAGALKPRDDAKLLGTPKESTLLKEGNSFYKTFAIECSRATISVDMFLFGSAYQDVASLTCLPHYTSGATFFYPGFSAARPEDALKFATEFSGYLSSPVGLEALTRVRTSRGIHLQAFHGNFFLRSTDLLAMPAVPEDQSYMIELEIDETITSPFIVMQCGILYTTALGERRIRVTTLALPTTSNLSEVYASADQIALTSYLANKAVERTQQSKLEDARDAVQNKLIDVMTAYKGTMTSAGAGASGQLAIAANMAQWPLLALGLLKHVALRPSSQIVPDLRAYAHALLTMMPAQLLVPYLHPSFYSLHNMPLECGTVGDQGVVMPIPLPLSSERLERHGLFLIEDGQTIFLWVGRDSVPQLIQDVFDLPDYSSLRGGKYTLPLLDNDFSQRVNAIVGKVRESRRGVYYPSLFVVKEDGEPPLRLWALSALILDRGDQTPSYQQFLGQLRDKVNGGSY